MVLLLLSVALCSLRSSLLSLSFHTSFIYKEKNKAEGCPCIVRATLITPAKCPKKSLNKLSHLHLRALPLSAYIPLYHLYEQRLQSLPGFPSFPDHGRELGHEVQVRPQNVADPWSMPLNVY